jgi:hypothetical protein
MRGTFLHLSARGDAIPAPVGSELVGAGTPGAEDLLSVHTSWTETRRIRAVVNGNVEHLAFEKLLEVKAIVARRRGWMFFSGSKGTGRTLLQRLWPDDAVRPHYSERPFDLALVLPLCDPARYDIAGFQLSGVSLKGLPNLTLSGVHADPRSLADLRSRGGSNLDSITLRPVQGTLARVSLSSQGGISMTVRKSISWDEAVIQLLTVLDTFGVLDG